MCIRDKVAFICAATLGVSLLWWLWGVCVSECVCECGECMSVISTSWDADPGIVDMVTVLCTELSFVLKKILFQ